MIIKIENLHENMTIKNYKDLCAILEIPEMSSDSKARQLRELKIFATFHREGFKYIIDEIYETPKLELIKIGKGYTRYNNFCVLKEDWNSIGVYKIFSNDSVYVGSTIAGFRERFMRHRSKDNTLCTRDLILENKAYFTILEVCDGMTEPEIRKRENLWIDCYVNHPKWRLINQNPAWSFTDKSTNVKKNPKKKYKCIRIEDDKYFDAVELLKYYGYKNNIKGLVD